MALPTEAPVELPRGVAMPAKDVGPITFPKMDGWERIYPDLPYIAADVIRPATITFRDPSPHYRHGYFNPNPIQAQEASATPPPSK